MRLQCVFKSNEVDLFVTRIQRTFTQPNIVRGNISVVLNRFQEKEFPPPPSGCVANGQMAEARKIIACLRPPSFPPLLPSSPPRADVRHLFFLYNFFLREAGLQLWLDQQPANRPVLVQRAVDHIQRPGTYQVDW